MMMMTTTMTTTMTRTDDDNIRWHEPFVWSWWRGMDGKGIIYYFIYDMI
jgi:hypothetical protein